MPRAPPSSALVSEMAEAAPARSGGAAVRTKSVTRVIAGARPTEKMTRRGHHRGQPGGRGDLREDRKADGRDGHSARHHVRRAKPAHERGRDQRTDDEAERPGQRPETRLQGGKPEHELKVLRDEDVRAERHEDRERVRDQGDAEGGRPEEAQVDQRIGQRALPSQENDADGDARGNRQRRQPPEAMLGNPLQAVDHEQHARKRQRRAHEVEPPGVGVAELRKEPRPHDEQQHHDGDVQQENGAPVKVLQHDTAEERSDRAADRVAGDPDGDGDRALSLVVKHVANQGQGRGRQRRAGDAEQRAGRDQHAGAVGERGDDRGGPERGRPDHQQLAAADPVSQRAHRDQRPGDQEAVDVDDPQELGGAGLQVGAQSRHGQVQHRQVHRVEDAWQGNHREADPLAAGRSRCVARADRGSSPPVAYASTITLNPP